MVDNSFLFHPSVWAVELTKTEAIFREYHNRQQKQSQSHFWDLHERFAWTVPKGEMPFAHRPAGGRF